MLHITKYKFFLWIRKKYFFKFIALNKNNLNQGSTIFTIFSTKKPSPWRGFGPTPGRLRILLSAIPGDTLRWQSTETGELLFSDRVSNLLILGPGSTCPLRELVSSFGPVVIGDSCRGPIVNGVAEGLLLRLCLGMIDFDLNKLTFLFEQLGKRVVKINHRFVIYFFNKILFDIVRSSGVFPYCMCNNEKAFQWIEY